ncbi:MAG: bifunctional phosphoribosylaminoimidazolecarboxamide formyltransferase/IMP cyclohydrolase [Rhodanobacter sp.]|jgi:phosphoribosylaminoimidazolecarboxamide formyltransferase/IMP cyclohydrolase|nr:bifunctional phosphoribosylaminoimidazolecarboxamide formyltransferase/IMP cyclohydrolase [Rhodanobacter sp.]
MPDTPLIPVRRALLSVSDKTGLLGFARALDAHGVQLVSTGGTAKMLRGAGLPVTDVATLTGFPEIMDGRVKTLHPAVHGGLLGRQGIDDATMEQHHIASIDLLVVNLYPFEQATAAPDCTLAQAIENIDIGGPAMLRAAAKNHERVTVVVDPADYTEVLAALAQGGTSLALRRHLATKTFAHTARYDGLVATWLGTHDDTGQTTAFPPSLRLAFERKRTLRYGENPHQNAALYVAQKLPQGTIAGARLLFGKEPSYNNIADADAALECVKAFRQTPACVIVKHANPCGVALGADLAQAYERAYACDPVSAFGGIIAFNRRLDATTANMIIKRQFVEVIVAPQFEAAAIAAIAAKPNVRVLATGEWDEQPPATFDCKCIAGGLLVQDTDRDTLSAADLKIVTRRAPDADELRDLLFAWHVAMFVKSNAIVYAREGRTIGIGAGQMSRVVSTKIAAVKAAEANLTIPGSVMASDAFFPFRDGIDTAAATGIRAVIQPGGSMRDTEVIDAANEHDIAMVFTGLRHFRH